MTTTPDLHTTTAALIASTQRRLDEALAIRSPQALGIVADRTKNGRRAPRRSPRRKFIR